jgi:hypothetical protein
MQRPLSLSDSQLTTVMQLAGPLAPPDRSAFLAALAQRLQHEPQPLGDGTIHRAACELLTTGRYQRSAAVAVGAAAARHQTGSGA